MPRNRFIAPFLFSALLASSCNKVSIKTPDYYSESKSLTGGQFAGKKYYIGWGAAGDGDPEMMQNEVRFDVLHTHNIFTTGLGGQYTGAKLIDGQGGESQVKAAWSDVKSKMSSQDMFVQYSSGHGYEQGLGVGLTYSEIADTVLSLPGKELVVFTMACHSGGLVNEFERRKSVWQDFASQGRTLLVMASSSVQELSSTGPGTDAGEQAGTQGSAGSAFGHALWKSLTGNADGYLDGVKDGFLSLGEIIAYTTDRTKEIGDHVPVYTGNFNPNLIMNASAPGASSAPQSPSAEGKGTEGLTDEQIRSRVSALDKTLDKQFRNKRTYGLVDGLATRAGAEVYVALGVKTGTQDAILLASGEEGTTAMVACPQASSAECRIGQPGSISFVSAGVAGNRPVFKSVSAVTLTANLRIAFSAFKADQSANGGRFVEIRAKGATLPPTPSTTPNNGGVQGSSLRIRDLSFTVPAGWTLAQEAVNGSTTIYTFTSNGESFTIYAAPAAQGNLKSFAGGAGAQVVQDARAEQKGSKQWQVMDTKKSTQTLAKDYKGKTYLVNAFWGDFGGVSYYGYAKSERSGAPKQIVDSFLNSVQ